MYTSQALVSSGRGLWLASGLLWSPLALALVLRLWLVSSGLWSLFLWLALFLFSLPRRPLSLGPLSSAPLASPRALLLLPPLLLILSYSFYFCLSFLHTTGQLSAPSFTLQDSLNLSCPSLLKVNSIDNLVHHLILQSCRAYHWNHCTIFSSQSHPVLVFG